MNIRIEADRNAIEAKGFHFVTVDPRGENKGHVISKHRTYDAAEKAARGRDLRVVAMDSAAYF